MIRKAEFMGRFYPSENSELTEMIDEWESKKGHFFKSTIKRSKAVVVPHAGYVFSGEVAWRAIKSINPSQFTRIVIIGPSHRHAFPGVSVSNCQSFQSVAGKVSMDSEFANELFQNLYLTTDPKAHMEHSTEVQVPLIQKLAPQTKIVEIVYGQHADKQLYLLINYLMNCKDTAIVISSDLSHYHNESEAHGIDNHIIDAISHLDMSRAKCGEACGFSGIKALVNSAKEFGLTSSIIEYTTSAASPYGNHDEVVGYLSALFGE